MTDKAASDLDVFQNIVQLSGDFPKLTEPLISAIDKERGLLIESFFKNDKLYQVKLTHIILEKRHDKYSQMGCLTRSIKLLVA